MVKETNTEKINLGMAFFLYKAFLIITVGYLWEYYLSTFKICCCNDVI